MAFSDLDEELDNLRNSQSDSIHYEYDDDGEISSESATLDWDYVHPNMIAGNALKNSGDDLTDALRWVLQDKKKSYTHHYWQAADKLGIDLFALGVNSGKEVIKEMPDERKMKKLWSTLGMQHVTMRKDESGEDFRIRMNDPSNWDAMKSDSVSAKPGFESEFSFPDKGGESRVGVTEALRKLAVGFVDPGGYGFGDGATDRYEIAVNKAARQLASKLPPALRNQSANIATKLSMGEELGRNDWYASALENLDIGDGFNKKFYGDTTDLSHTVRGVGKVFGAIDTGGVERDDLKGIAGWKSSASSNSGGHVLDELHRAGLEDQYADIADAVGVSNTLSNDPQLMVDGRSPISRDFTPELVRQIQENINNSENGFTLAETLEDLEPPAPEEIPTSSSRAARKGRIAAAKLANEKQTNIPVYETPSVPTEVQPNNSTQPSAVVTKSRLELGAAALAQEAEAVKEMPTEIPDIHRRPGDEDLIISNHPQGTQGWHDARNKLLTAADAGLVNSGKYTKEGLRRKLDSAAGTPQMSEELYNSNFDRGHRTEELSRLWYEKKFNTNVTEMGLIENPKYPGLGASVDGLVGKDGLFEAKAPAFKFSNVTEGHAYYDQVQMQMAVTGRDWADLVQAKAKQGFVPRGEDPLEYNVVRHKRNEAFIERQLPKWNKLAREVRIASKTASPEDYIENMKDHSHSNPDFDERMEEVRARNFETRLQERLKDSGLNLDVDENGNEVLSKKTLGQKFTEAMSMKDSVKEGLLEARDEINRQEGGTGGGGGSSFGSGLNFLSKMMGRSLDTLGSAMGSAGKGDLISAASSIVRSIPIVGGFLSGGLEAMQGFISRSTEEAAVIGEARTMGVDYNSLNNTNRQGLVYGMTQQQATNLIGTTSSASQGMSVGDSSEASKIVVGTRGFISFADIQQYGEDPIQLGKIAIQRMKAANLSKGQISSLLRGAGLGDTLKLVDATDQQDRIAENTKLDVSLGTQQRLSTLSGTANTVINNSRQKLILQGAEDGSLQSILSTATSTVQMMEEGVQKSMNLFGESAELVNKALSGDISSPTDLLSKMFSKDKKPTDMAPESTSSGATPIDKNSWGVGGEKSKEMEARARSVASNLPDLRINKQISMTAEERGRPEWREAYDELIKTPPSNDEWSKAQYLKTKRTLEGKLGIVGVTTPANSVQKAQANNSSQEVKVSVSVDKFTVSATATSEGKMLSKASRAGQVSPNTL